MKATKTLTCVLLVAGAACCWAADKTAAEAGKTGKEAKRVKQVQSPKAEKMVLTGSHIPRAADVRGRIACTESHLVVLDSDFIQRSGASDVSDLLRRSHATR
jgi:hypothetical protein